MAQKKGTGRTQGTGKGNGRTKQTAASPNQNSGFRFEIVLIIACAAAVFLEISNFGVCGAVGNAISGFFFGVFGCIQYILPVAIFVGMAFLFANGFSSQAIKKVVYSGVLILDISILAQLIVKLPDGIKVGEIYMNSFQGKSGGGFIGGGLALLLKNAIGVVGAYLVVIVIAIIMIILLTEKSLIRLLQNSGSKMMDGFRDAKERGQEYQERREEERLSLEEVRAAKRAEREAAKQAQQERKQNELTRRREAAEAAKAKAELEKDVLAAGQEPEYNRFHKKTDKKLAKNLTVFPEGGEQGSVKKDEFKQKNALQQEEVHEITMTYEEMEEDDFPDTRTPVHTQKPEPVSAVTVAKSVMQKHTTTNTNTDSMNHENTTVQTKSETSSPWTRKDSAFSENPFGTEAHKVEPVEMGYEDEAAVPAEAPVKKRNVKHTRQSAREAAEATAEVTAHIQKAENNIESDNNKYQFPPIELLTKGSGTAVNNEEYIQDTIVKLQSTLNSFGVGATVTDYSCGPAVTRFELQPEQGVKVSKIVGLSDDIKLSLAATDIRIEAPIPGKSAVGIEIPNKENSAVLLRDLLEDKAFKDSISNISFAAGKDISGQTVVADIAKMPHLLIAGATGSGKSVCINTIIMSILYKASPKDVKLIMIDPKVVELTAYNGIPHLLIPVVTDPKKAAGALNWAVQEMTKRYQLFADYNVRNLKGFNKKVEETLAELGITEEESDVKKMSQIVVIVDELADLMMVAKGEVEDAIVRLAQLARAAGIHLIIATQRPSVDVITGLIKANVPSRIAFAVSSFVDSKTILDMGGAEKLLGKGDMLFYPTGYPKPVRVQGAFVSDEEVGAVVDFLKNNCQTSASDADISSQIESNIAATSVAAASSESGEDKDEYFRKAAELIIESDKASIGMLQRRLKIGFNRAARIMDQLAEAGIVGPDEGTKPRQILMSQEQFEQYVEEYL